jgi:hypothetical protein
MSAVTKIAVCVWFLFSVGCVRPLERTKLPEWHKQAISAYILTSAVMAHYESLPTFIKSGAANYSKVCGDIDLNKFFDPALMSLTELKNLAPKGLVNGKNIEVLLGEGHSLITLLKSKASNHYRIAIETNGIDPEDHCLSAADIVATRMDFEEVFNAVLIATTGD